MTIRTLIIPCADCDQRRESLNPNTFRVIDCQPMPSQVGFCRFRFERIDTAAARVATDTFASKAPALAQIALASQLTATLTNDLLPTQKLTIEAIINIFETSEVQGNYGQVTVLPHDTGRLTFGRSQTTLGSGNLVKLIRQYCANPAAIFATPLAEYLARLDAKAVALDTDQKLHNILRASADDVVMRDTQDKFFDETYWKPALKRAMSAGITTPLGIAVVYDSTVHGSWDRIRDFTDAQIGSVASNDEKHWIATYVKVRRAWLAGHSNPIIRSTVYRMDALQRLIDQLLWGLPLPLVVRQAEISTASLAAPASSYYLVPQSGSRQLSLSAPLMRGLDVRRLQLGLSLASRPIIADGVFGQTSVKQLKEYQIAQGLAPTGIASAELVARLASQFLIA